MANEVQVFDFEQMNVRTVEINDEVWFVATDVASTLGLTNISMSLKALDDDERSKFNLGRQGDVNIVSEAGLYNLIGSSRKAESKRFMRWVRHEVLPSIRKTGSYQVPTTVDGQIALLATGYSNMTQKVERVAGDVDYLMNQAGLSQDQRYELEKARNRRATYLLGGHNSNAYQLVGRRMFRQMFHDFKERFQITAYGRLPRAKFEQGVAYVNAWTPDTNMRMDIEDANNQIDLNL